MLSSQLVAALGMIFGVLTSLVAYAKLQAIASAEAQRNAEALPQTNVGMIVRGAQGPGGSRWLTFFVLGQVGLWVSVSAVLW